MHLEIAANKMEAVMLIGRIEGSSHSQHTWRTPPRTPLEYLEVWIDMALTFKQHIFITAEKAERVVAAMARLMPRVKGPSVSKRKVMRGW